MSLEVLEELLFDDERPAAELHRGLAGAFNLGALVFEHRGDVGRPRRTIDIGMPV